VTAREGALHSIGRIELFYLLHLSKPRADRTVYRTIRDGKVSEILELGIGTGQRAERMIALAAEQTPDRPIRYVGLDPFESGDGSGLSLKAAFQQLRQTGVRLKLVPGPAMESLPRVANDLGQFDLVVISAAGLAGQTPRAWFFLQRLLRSGCAVLSEETGNDGQPAFRVLSLAEIEARSRATRIRKAA
jgi:SAM-dependent methyltransferase